MKYMACFFSILLFNLSSVCAEEMKGNLKVYPKLTLSGENYYSKYNLDGSYDEDSGVLKKNYYVFSQDIDFSFIYLFDKSFYISPYVGLRVLHDFGENSWNCDYWGNNNLMRLGVRAGINEDFQRIKEGYTGGFSSSFFAEYQLIANSIDGSKNEIPSEISRENFTFGINAYLYKTYKLSEDISCWAQSWGEFAYRSTDFNEKGLNDYLVGTVTAYVGLAHSLGVFGVRPYLKGKVINDLFGKNWNGVPWNNYYEYGGGLRLSLESLTNNSIYLYGEYVGISFPEQAAQLNNDFRVGVNCWVPILDKR